MDFTLILSSQKLDEEHSNWLLHAACLDILLGELGLAEANMKTWDDLALFEYRTHLGLYGEFMGMRDTTGAHLKHIVSAARKPWMRRLDWTDGPAELWKFRSPKSCVCFCFVVALLEGNTNGELERTSMFSPGICRITRELQKSPSSSSVSARPRDSPVQKGAVFASITGSRRCPSRL